jgi:hypothetical protein
VSFDRIRRRHQLVHAVLAEVASTGRPVIQPRWQAAVDEEFGGFGDFLREVQVRWYRAYDARLDALLEAPPGDMRAALVGLWHELAGIMPAARLLLDAHLDHPALAVLHDNHGRQLHAATGIHLALRPAAPPPPAERAVRPCRLFHPRPSTA